MNVKQFYIDIGGNYNDALAIMMNDILIAKMLTKFINGNSCEEMVTLYEKNREDVMCSWVLTFNAITL